MRAHRLALLAAAPALAAACATGSALAHVAVDSTRPAKGASARTSIRTVKVTFTGPILRGTLRVTGPGGRVASVGDGRRDPRSIRRLRVALKSALEPGRYRARWTATSADGHRAHGSFRFRLRD